MLGEFMTFDFGAPRMLGEFMTFGVVAAVAGYVTYIVAHARRVMSQAQFDGDRE